MVEIATLIKAGIFFDNYADSLWSRGPKLKFNNKLK